MLLDVLGHTHPTLIEPASLFYLLLVIDIASSIYNYYAFVFKYKHKHYCIV